jgi:hypothetical protein
LCYRIVVLGAILPNLFPGWVTSSAAAITFTFGINQDLYRYIAVGLLVIIGLIVSLSPVVYQSFGKIEMVLVSVILIFLVFAIFKATKGSVWAGIITEAPQGIAEFPKTMSVIGAASLLGARAFAGVGAPTTWCRVTTLGTRAWGWGLASPTSSRP